MEKKNIIPVLTAIALASAACSETDLVPGAGSQNVIVASIEAPDASDSRTIVDGQPTGGTVGLLWTDGDELGVFDAKGENHARFQKYTQGNVAEAEFGGNVSWLGKYAYYPYNAANDGEPITALKGTLPAEQTVGTGNIPGDYKVGRVQDGTNKFVFAHLFSLVRIDLDAAGTVLAGEPLEYVKFTSPNTIAGDFTFNARRVTYTNVTNGSNTITVKWPQGTTLSEPLSEYFSVLPTVTGGAELNFEVKTANHTATFSAASKVSFVKEHLYNFPINLVNISKNYEVKVVDKAGNTVALIEGETPTEPIVTTGTFTCATYNVDGLSVFNNDGPGSKYTKVIAERINSDYNWDFFAVEEDFAYNDELVNGLTLYDHGEFSGNSTRSCDGLNFFWKQSSITVTGGTRTKWNDVGGSITDGDKLVSKGFRHYEVTVAEGVVIDVYITHMQSGNYPDYRNKQLTQFAEYLKLHNNNRPAIFMGDTNCRYTRDKIEENLINVVKDAQFIGRDPWVEFSMDSKFINSVTGWPKYPSGSIMTVASSGSTTIDGVKYPDDDNNGAGYGYQKGEVVDKIIYFNVEGAPLQIKAKTYLNDESFVREDGKTHLADHFPVVADFEWTLTSTK